MSVNSKKISQVGSKIRRSRKTWLFTGTVVALLAGATGITAQAANMTKVHIDNFGNGASNSNNNLTIKGNPNISGINIGNFGNDVSNSNNGINIGNFGDNVSNVSNQNNNIHFGNFENNTISNHNNGSPTGNFENKTISNLNNNGEIREGKHGGFYLGSFGSNHHDSNVTNNKETSTSNQVEKSSPKQNKLTLVNEKSFAASDFSAISLSYQADDIEVVASSDNQIHLQEYMTAEDATYLAKISQVKGNLDIHIGKRPHGANQHFRSKIVLAVPASYKGALKIKLGSGSLTGQDLHLTNLTVNGQSGTCQLKAIQCENLNMTTSIGEVKLEDLSAKTLKVRSSSGTLNLQKVQADEANLKGSSGNLELRDSHFTNLTGQLGAGNLTILSSHVTKGNLRTNCGSIRAELDGFNKLEARSSSGDVRLTVAAGAEFGFKLKTSMGDVSSEGTGAQYKVKKSNRQQGEIGHQAQNQLKVQSTMGNVHLEIKK